VAITNGYCTLGDFKNYKDITSSDTTDDDVLEKIIESASRFIDNQSGQRFYSSTGQTLYFTAEDANFLLVPNLQSVTTLKTDDDGDRTYEDTWTTGDYDLMPYNASYQGVPYSWIQTTPESDYSFPLIEKGVEIKGDWGYSAVPDEIRLACIEIAHAANARRSGQNLTGIAEVTAAGVVISPEDITPFAKAILMQYQRAYGS